MVPELQACWHRIQTESLLCIANNQLGMPPDLDLRVAEALEREAGAGLFPSEIVAMLIAVTMAGPVILGNSPGPDDEQVDAGNKVVVGVA